MSSEHNEHADAEPDDHGVLAEAGIDTTAIGILGTGTAQVKVVLPTSAEEPDDDVVDDIPGGDVRSGDVRSGGIVIELPADEPEDDSEVVTGELDEDLVESVRVADAASAGDPDTVDAEIVDEAGPLAEGDATAEEDAADAAAVDDEGSLVDEATADGAAQVEPADPEDEADEDDPEDVADDPAVEEPRADAVDPKGDVDAPAADEAPGDAVDPEDESSVVELGADVVEQGDDGDVVADEESAVPDDPADADGVADADDELADDGEPAEGDERRSDPEDVADSEGAADDGAAEAETETADSDDVPARADAIDGDVDADDADAGEADSEDAAVDGDAMREPRSALAAPPLPSGYEPLRAAAIAAEAASADRAPARVGSHEPAESDDADESAPHDDLAAAREDEDMSDPTDDAPASPPITRPSFIDPAATTPAKPGRPVEPTSRRVGEVSASAARESADVLTADRLLDAGARRRPEPEGGWQRFVYRASGRLVNFGDSKKVRARKDLTRRIGAPMDGAARFVPVLSRKGGVGKTTVTALLGMALADARDDRVIAVDANPDRGTLAERVQRSSSKTVRDLVRNRDAVHGYADMSSHVVRDETRLDVLASDTDPHLSEAFSDQDYRDVAGVASRYYSIILTDTGTGIVHSVMGATLDLADQLVVVAGESVDEARLASETLTWLESNGYADRVEEAIVVLNQSAPGTPLVRLDELDAHFRTRVRTVIRLPYDARLATGSSIVYAELNPETREAARRLAASVVEGLRRREAA